MFRTRSIVMAAAFCATVIPLHAQGVPTARPLRPLSEVEIPEPSNLEQFVRDRSAAIALGKAFFWDMQAGSDGKVACATCHWHAGADARFRATLGQPVDKHVAIGDTLKVLSESDFPLTKISGDPTSPDSTVVSNNELVVGSQGAFLADFVRVVEGRANEVSSPKADDVFNAGGVNVRTVTAETRHRSSTRYSIIAKTGMAEQTVSSMASIKAVVTTPTPLFNKFGSDTGAVGTTWLTG